MAPVATDTPQKTAKNQGQAPGMFGAYSASNTFTNAYSDIGPSGEKIPDAKRDGSLAFIDSKNRWLKDLAITTTDPNSFHRSWRTQQEKDESDHRTWANAYGGRLIERLPARGLVGAGCYAGGNMIAAGKMSDFSLHEAPKNTLQHIARFIDNTAGRAIKSTVQMITHDPAKAEKFVTFRDTVKYKGYNGNYGRSLGHEAVLITFDFACMSFGDYMTRYALSIVDPNTKTQWIKNGHIDVPDGLKELGYNIWRGATYAAGEDIANMAVYPFFVRKVDHILDKSNPGYIYDAHRSLNGGSFKIHDGKVVGDFQGAGVLSVVIRFTGYNVLTKGFRDLYGKVQTEVEQFHDRWKKGDHSFPHFSINPGTFTSDGIAKNALSATRYLIRTPTKVTAYMLPASLAFALIRSPQSKIRGLAIDPQYGILGRDVIEGAGNASFNKVYDKTEGYDHNASSGEQGFEYEGSFKPVKPGSRHADDMQVLMPDGSYRPKTPKEMGLYYLDANGIKTPTEMYPFKNDRKDALLKALYSNGAPWYSYITDPLGRISLRFGSQTERLIGRTKIPFDPEHVEDFSRIFANASLAYTPYFMLKTDILSAEWDTKRTDMALDRTLDSIFHLKWGEFKAGLGEVMHAMIREPFPDRQREQMAQRLRWGADPEHMSNEAYQLSGDRSRLNYLEHANAKPFAQENLKPKKILPVTYTQLKPRETGWAAQEALRQFQDPNSQGQSVH